MYLKELSINGFKSFAKKSELEFPTAITAIVGPNGSGKSNVAEAFRFVLGEQSIKSMRGKKGEDLIFNGSLSTSRANRASVTVTLENKVKDGAKVFPLDFDEIVIERVVHRDGTNEYLINGSRTRLKDVQELLAAANIGSTGHHIISQGEADRILSASPKERREMIEDALGLKIFQYKKAESERKLKKTLENIAQVESLRKEVQPHLRFLEKQIKKIEKSVELQNALKIFYAEYLRREDSYIAFHTDRLTAEKRVPEGELTELERKLETAKARMHDEKHDVKRDALMELEGKMSSLRVRRNEVVRKSGQLEGQVLYLERRIEEIAKRAEKITEIPIAYGDMKRATTEVEKTVEQALKNGTQSFLERALRDVVSILNTLLHNASKKEVRASTEIEADELVHLRKEKNDSDAELAQIIEQETQLEEEYKILKTSIEAESSETREAEREVFSIMNAQRESSESLARIERELSVLMRDREEFKRELQEAVSLLGRDAALYFEFSILDDQGKELSREELIAEERRVQHERRRELEKMKIRLEELGTGSNEDVLKEYKDVKERDEFLVREVTDLEASVEKLQLLIDDLTRDLNEQFIFGIDTISKEFSQFFILMFGGGSADLLRVKPKVKKKKEDDFSGLAEEIPDEDTDGSGEESEEEGIEIDVKLPNKRVKGLEMLSGGERALTSIALIFAMSQINPPLFIILDETDAALDEANSRRYGDMITALAEKSQLILITHNRETMSRAGVLYGVTMGGDGISKLLSVKFDEAVTVAK